MIFVITKSDVGIIRNGWKLNEKIEIFICISHVTILYL